MAMDPMAEMIVLLQVARPMMQEKCCHYDWCVERRGVESNNRSEGWPDIEDGMHPGCAPYRRWLDQFDLLVPNDG